MVFFQHHWIQFLLGKERTGMNGWMGKIYLVLVLKVITSQVLIAMPHSKCCIAGLSLKGWS